MNKFYIYILFIIFGLCIYLYINKKDTFNIGGRNQIELICNYNSDNIMSQLLTWIDGLVYKETIIPCYDTHCNELSNYNDLFRRKYSDKNVMLIENDIYTVINPILNSDYIDITDNNDYKYLNYSRTFNFKELDITNEIDSMIKDILDYFNNKEIIKEILKNQQVYNNIFTSDCLSTSKIYIDIEDMTKYFGLNIQYNEQMPKFSRNCNKYLQKFNFIRPRGDYEYNNWHQDVSFESLGDAESYPYYFNCLITPPKLRKGPLDRHILQEDCLYMDTQVTTNLTEEVSHKYTGTTQQPYRTIEELKNNRQVTDDVDVIDSEGYATSNYQAINKIITENSKILREHYITGIMFDNFKLYHSRGTFRNTNGIILNDKDKQSYINIYKDESSQINEWFSAVISDNEEYNLNLKSEFKKFCASDFLTLPTFNSFCRRIIRVTLIFKES